MSNTGISPPPIKRRKLKAAAPADAEGTKASSTENLSVFSWNVNGIEPFLQQPISAFFQSNRATAGAPKASLRTFLSMHGWPEMLFLQEVKINPGDNSTIRAVEKAIARRTDEAADCPEYVAHFCLPSDRYNARGFGRKIYGVCTVIRKDFSDAFVARVRPVDWDVEGRILVVETKVGLLLPKVAIMNLYAVNGTDNIYKDPKTGVTIGTRHDRKLQVHSLLQSECQRLESEGFKVIIAGDINIARSTIDGHPNLRTFPRQHVVNRQDFEQRFFGNKSVTEKNDKAGLEMIDTFRLLHPEKRSYSYYPRGRTFGESCDRVDMIIASKDLAPCCRDAGILETPADRGPSDHVPIYAQFVFEPPSRVSVGAGAGNDDVTGV